jgi:hypothetical protein
VLVAQADIVELGDQVLVKYVVVQIIAIVILVLLNLSAPLDLVEVEVLA